MNTLTVALRGAALFCCLLISTAQAEQVVFSEVHYNPAAGKPEYIEIENLTATVFDIADWKFSDGVDYTFPAFNAADTDRTFLTRFERLIVSSVDEATLRAAYTIPASVEVYGPWTGSLSNGGETITLSDRNGIAMATVSYDDDGHKWPISADGAGHSLRLVKKNRGASDWRNWAASVSPDGTPGTEAAGADGVAFPDPSVDPGSLPLVDLDSTWKYDESGVDHGTAWRSAAFDDSAWMSGAGLFGKESATKLAQMPAPRQTVWSTGTTVTYYLRKEFEWNSGSASGFISMDAVLDDGAVLYLNGQEIGRHRLPAGTITHTTAATSAPVEAVIEEKIIEGDITGILQQGTNLLAVEVHNNSLSSSDVIFAPVIRVSGSGGVATINEVRPASGVAGFIEIYNPSASVLNLKDHYISGDASNLTAYQIPTDTFVPAGGFGTVEYTAVGLPLNGTAEVYLTHPDGTSVLDAINASLAANGPSIGRKPAGSNDWFLFNSPTPGVANIDSANLLGLLELNEVHYAADGSMDWVEIAALTDAAVPLSGLSLASLADLSDAVPLSGSVGGNGVASFNVSFAPNDDGEVRVYLATGGGTVIAAQKFVLPPAAGIEGFQADVAGGEWFAGPGHTRDAVNAPVRNTDVIINEIMYDAPSDALTGEFVELYNRGGAPVDIGGWRFVDGIGFEFAAGTMIAPGAHLVVAADPGWMAANYSGVSALGPFSGRLADSGELLRMEDALGNLADEVDYKPSGDWPELADGDGSSMELKHPDMDNDSPSAWADSDEANKTSFETFTYTAPFDQATWNPLSVAQELHMHLVGDAYMIIKNVSLRLNGAGANLIQNPSVQSPSNSSALGWVIQGTHWASFVSGGDMHLISDGHGDNKGNRAEVDISALTYGQSYTLEFEARWVNGKSRLIAQTLDHGFGTTFYVPIPNDLGTPGASNSRLLSSAAPTVSDVMHSPAVPAPGEPVVITARVDSVPALSSIEVVHRADSSTNTTSWQRAPMFDNGVSGGDLIAGDGIYSATLTAYNSQGNIAQFYVEAEAAGGEETALPKLGADRPALFVIDGRIMPDILMRERFVVSEYDRAALTTAIGHSATFGWDFPRTSNHFFNATFISNEEEVFYNAEIRKSGSPFTRATNSALAHGKWKLPGDRLFRERRRSVFDASGTSEGSGTPRFYDDRIARYFLYLMGHPVNEMEFVHWVVNGDAFKERENHEPISNDFLDRNWENGSEGTLLRIDDEWRFTSDDGDSRSSRNADWSYKNSDNPVRYHSEWIMRSRESEYDYGTFIEWVKAVGQNNFTEETINRMANRDMLCLNAAVRGYDADWDTLTVNRGKNAYFYRPPGTGGGWMLIHWDGDRVFERETQAIIGGRTGVPNYFNEPYNRRVLNYYLSELLTKHTKDSDRTEAWMQAEKAAVAGTGVVMTDSHYRNWFTIREGLAQNFITSAVMNASFAVNTAGGTTTASTITLSGVSPSSVYDVRVVGQPWATSNWTSTTGWQLSGVQLQEGVNSIVVEGVNHDGVVAESATFTITKTGNAPPVLALDSNPQSRNVALSDALGLDAGDSYDPEGTALIYSWSASPAADVSIQPSGATATAAFTSPGLYTITVTATDADGQSDSLTRQFAVFGGEGFSSFGNSILEPFWREQNVEVEDNTPLNSWYSLVTYDGRLHLHVPEDREYSLGLPAGAVQTLNYVALGDTWSYDESNTDFMATFADPAFDDSAWTTGAGIFGDDGAAPFPAPGLNTPLEENIANHVTYYFRKEFTFAGNPEDSEILIGGIIDDGVRFWLNGTEFYRSAEMPATGSIVHTTSATGNVSPERELIDFGSHDGSTLLNVGTNVLAVDLHNSSAGSSDIVFAAQMDITAEVLTGGGTLADTLHPWVQRDLPTSGDWALQTDFELAGIQLGDFATGLMVEVERAGARYRYGIGYRDGTELAVVQVGPTGTNSTLTTLPYASSDGMVVRIRREADELIFEWRPGEDFQEVHRLSLPAGSTAIEGGPFAATESPQMLDVLFDYVMLIDPSATSSTAGDLVITEVMYNPNGGSDYEYLELYNAGPTAINLTGYRFPQGTPFDEFVFGNVTIAPGAYLLVVSDLSSFQSRYGNGLNGIIAGEWAGGSLSNGGEVITLLDDNGLVVLSFEYNDSGDWPTDPDGNGTSLTLADTATGSTSIGTDWVASASTNGTPGGPNTAIGPFAAWMAARGETDPLATLNGDPVNNLLMYAFGVDLAGGNLEASLPAVGTTAFGPMEWLTIDYRRRLGDPGVGYLVELSRDGITWTDATASLVEVTAPSAEGDGTERYQLRLQDGVSINERCLLRVRVTAP